MSVSRTRSDHRCRVCMVLALVLLAIVLGLGLGIGLKHRHEKHESDTTSSTPPASLPTLQPQPVSNSVLLNGINGQPSSQTRTYNFNISEAMGAPDGFLRKMLVVNGLYPGPTIEANQGDRLVINVQNNLPNATSIHWHGLFQNGTNFYDGSAGITECGIPPGRSLTYNFTFGEFSGTTWWQDSTTAVSTQYTDGITGALIVHPSTTPSGFPSWDEELMVQMADWYHDMSEDLLAQYFSPFGIQGTQGNEPVADAGTLNGLGQYFAAGSGGSYSNFTLERGKTYRIRLVNSGSFASIRFSVDSHPLTLIEADGTLLKPTIVSGVTIAVAQRYSVLLHANVTANANATYWMRAAVQDDMFTYIQPGQNLDIRGVIRYTDASSPTGLPGDLSSPDPGPGIDNALDVDGTTPLIPFTVDPAPNVTRFVPVSFAFERGNDGSFLGYMNTTSWSPLPNNTTLLETLDNPTEYSVSGVMIALGDQLMVVEDSIQVLDLRVDNLDDGDHPFHLHGHRPWIMGTGAGRYVGQAIDDPNPLRRDTVLIPAYSYMVLRFVTDNPGLWAFHCHLAWHMAAGLVMQINSLPSKTAQLDVPEPVISYCAVLSS
ncbi:multicopper oxidase 2A [Hysterangium stoloniferum]|nr:multicopper oxidase 2A [Hysterangium stoloniferum]